MKVRRSLLHGRCVNGPSLFLNAAGSPHNQYNLGLVSVKGLRVNSHRFVTEELLFSTVPNSYIMKVARPFVFVGSSQLKLDKLGGGETLFACFGRLRSTVMLSLCVVFRADLSNGVFFPPSFFLLLNFPIVQLGDRLPVLRSSNIAAAQWVHTVSVCSCTQGFPLSIISL